jgi:hypothetical protein
MVLAMESTTPKYWLFPKGYLVPSYHGHDKRAK